MRICYLFLNHVFRCSSDLGKCILNLVKLPTQSCQFILKKWVSIFKFLPQLVIKAMAFVNYNVSWMAGKYNPNQNCPVCRTVWICLPTVVSAGLHRITLVENVAEVRNQIVPSRHSSTIRKQAKSMINKKNLHQISAVQRRRILRSIHEF